MIDTDMNYFTVIEEHFQGARGSGSFRLSPLDWALIGSWKDSGIPLEAILRGIDRTFENWRRQPERARTQRVNSLAYCTQAIATETLAMTKAAPLTVRSDAVAPFSLENVRDFVARNAGVLEKSGYPDLAMSLQALDLEALYADLEHLEQELMAIEDTMITRLRATATDDLLAEVRRTLDRDLKPYREKMSNDQLVMLEKQFLERRLLESAGLLRLSLFYL